MDETGIRMQVLSLMAPMVYWAPPAFGLKLSQTYNDAGSAAHRRYPDRFVGLAMLPMQQPELAVEELERAAKLPGLRGVMMATAINGKNLDEKAFFPVYAKCEELGWPIFTHPVAPFGGERMSKYYLINLLGNPVEIGIAGYSLILGGVMDAFPKLDVMLPRAGGNVPWGIMRLDRTVERMPHLAQAKRPATIYLKRFYYDCIIESPHIVLYLIRLVGADRVLFGTDYPSPMRDARPTEFIQGLDRAAVRSRRHPRRQCRTRVQAVSIVVGHEAWLQPGRPTARRSRVADHNPRVFTTGASNSIPRRRPLPSFSNAQRNHEPNSTVRIGRRWARPRGPRNADRRRLDWRLPSHRVPAAVPRCAGGKRPAEDRLFAAGGRHCFRSARPVPLGLHR